MLLGSLSVLGLSLPAWADDKKEIDELEKKIADLQKKLVDLKKEPAAEKSAKKKLSLEDADKWRSIRTAVLSNDGKWFAHRVTPAEGDGEVILRSVADGKETKYPAGGGSGQLQFSFDSNWLAFSVLPYVKTGGMPGQPKPVSKLYLINTKTMEKTELENVSSCEFAGETACHIAYRKSGTGSADEEPSRGPRGSRGPVPTAPAAAPTTPAPSHSGTDLVVRNLAAGTELVFGNVADYSFDKAGNWLVTTIDAAGQSGNGVQLHDLKTGALYPIENGKAVYRQINWNEDRTAFTVTKSVDDAGYETKWISILGFSKLGPKPEKVVFDPKGDKSFPAEMAISTNRPANWNEGLDAFIFGIAERKKKEETRPGGGSGGGSRASEKREEPRKEGAVASSSARPTATATTPAKPDLVIWHWKDERLQPMQQVQSASDKQHTFLATYRIKDKKFIRLADEALKNVTVSPKNRYGIGRDTRAYDYMGNLDGRRYADIYSVDTQTGDRKKIVTKSRNSFNSSPTGSHFLYYDDGHFFACDLVTGKTVNLTAAIKNTSFVNDEDDHNVDKPPRFPLGWSRDGKTVILSDGWDLWAVSVEGKGGRNLTGNGRSDQIRYQGITQYEAEPKPGYDFTKPLYVTMYGEWTKKSGVGRIDPGTEGVKTLLWNDCNYGTPFKARNADVFAYTRQTAIDSPEYFLTDASFKESKKVTDSNPQQKDYFWCSGYKIVDYTGTKGAKLQGTLYLPANYEPGKQYPTVIYIYEKLTQGTHQYTPPGYRGGFNKSIYTTNGYAVLMPDITYRINDPGKSSVECILPALDAAIATGVVDGKKVGLHGHSWGGYQTAFGITQTKRFACAIAGAPLTDLISMYSSVYWNSGSANQPIFESSQGRFTAGYWDEQDAYIRNSPVFFAKNVETPLLLLHNDKDGAVDFTQGIEYYNTLRRLQKPVVMLQYKGENHGLAKQENQKDYAVRMREFFDHYLQGKPAPDWWQNGVPHLKMEEHLKGRK
ncbi:MAG: prolyl oligopeptidase family serine peptidase [Planctomycetia bacterium]|nr:prolyl oligopeptidase family serine peptidase [Planctomycetia bacterium]